MEDQRNFRSGYYEKVGCRSVEEKKSLEILLKENPVNESKLKQFLKLFSVPNLYRGALYLSLGVYPRHMESKEYVLQQKRETYNDLYRALEIMRYIDNKSTKSRVFYAMYLLENRQLDSSNAIQIYKDTTFSLIADVILGSLELDVVECYFLTKIFYKCSQDIANELPKLKQQTFSILEREDSELYNHLKSNNILDHLPYERWYPSIFASIINELALIRIFDRVAGGSTQIVIFIFIVLCSYTRYSMKSQHTTSGVIKLIENVDDTESDVIVNKAIDLWHKCCIMKKQ